MLAARSQVQEQTEQHKVVFVFYHHIKNSLLCPQSQEFPLFVERQQKEQKLWRCFGNLFKAALPQEMLTRAEAQEEAAGPRHFPSHPAPDLLILLGERIFSIKTSSLHGRGNQFPVRVAQDIQ